MRRNIGFECCRGSMVEIMMDGVWKIQIRCVVRITDCEVGCGEYRYVINTRQGEFQGP